MAPLPAMPRQWPRAFESAVRARDFARRRSMFAVDAVASGTWARAVTGVDNIVREQRENVWSRIRDFRLDADDRIRTSGDSARIAAGWSTEVTGPDGRPCARRSRGTSVLERRGGRGLAVHRHLSLLPPRSETVHGRFPGERS